MEIIVTHDMADFDALAAAVAAQRLHPGATIALGRRLGRGVRDFLALHKDRFGVVRVSDIDQEAVTHLVVVDVRRQSRLGELDVLLARVARRDPSIRVTVWDHHAAAADDLPADEEHVEPVGSVTTLLVEEIRQRALDVDVAEATLFSLGIHADTGSLRHAATTARDAEALAWLLRRGASLRVQNRYLTEAFTTSQRKVLAAALASTEVVRVGGLRVGFAIVELEDGVDGLDEVTTELLALEGHHALFGLYHVVARRRVHVVGRARSPWLDVGAALQVLGGGGHPPAGAATAKEKLPAEVRDDIIAALLAHPPRPTRVRDVMSSPVRTVTPAEPLARLAESLQSWQHTGVPVLRDGVLAGMISKRDIDKAVRGGRGHLTVASCMAHTVHATTEDTLLEDALLEMERADVGRLPVLRAGRIVGIVSRSDVIAFLYEEREPEV